MRRRSVSKYYSFGTQTRYLQDATPGLRIKDEDYVVDNIDRFLQNITDLDLDVTNRAAWKLYRFREELASSDNEKLSEDQAYDLAKIMGDIRLTLDAEIGGLDAFITTPKHLDVEKLLEDVPSLFAPNVFQGFPDIAKHGFIEGARCVAFEVSTAAAFHILRATEANLRHYYKSMIRQKRIKSELWGPIVEDLRIRPKQRNTQP